MYMFLTKIVTNLKAEDIFLCVFMYDHIVNLPDTKQRILILAAVFTRSY